MYRQGQVLSVVHLLPFRSENTAQIVISENTYQRYVDPELVPVHLVVLEYLGKSALLNNINEYPPLPPSHLRLRLYEGAGITVELPTLVEQRFIEFLYNEKNWEVDCGGFIAFLFGKSIRRVNGAGRMALSEWRMKRWRRDVTSLPSLTVVGLCSEVLMLKHVALHLADGLFLSKLGEDDVLVMSLPAMHRVYRTTEVITLA